MLSPRYHCFIDHIPVLFHFILFIEVVVYLLCQVLFWTPSTYINGRYFAGRVNVISIFCHYFCFFHQKKGLGRAKCATILIFFIWKFFLASLSFKRVLTELLKESSSGDMKVFVKASKNLCFLNKCSVWGIIVLLIIYWFYSILFYLLK